MLSVVWPLPSDAKKWTKDVLRSHFSVIGNIKDIMIRERNRKGTALLTFTGLTREELPTIEGLDINWIATRPNVSSARS